MKRIYLFTEVNSEPISLLGGKGANLAEMTKLDLPIPPGFIITTKAWKEYISEGCLSWELKKEIREKMGALEKISHKKFGGKKCPLLVSARSGAPVSMPGMLDTILCVGLTDENAVGLAKQFHDERFAFDCFRNFIIMFSNVVFRIQKEEFDQIEAEFRSSPSSSLNSISLKKIVESSKILFKERTRLDFPNCVYDQLFYAVQAIFDSWHSNRAKTYRRAHNIRNDLGTAVVVQEMVFGNVSEDSGTGVIFTRNPCTGKKQLFGEYLPKALGEDLVSGIRTPWSLLTLKRELPEVFIELTEASKVLEQHFRDMQDIEFTVERGKLFLLQTRSGKRTAQARAKIAMDLCKEGVISKTEAMRILNSVPLNDRLIQEEARNLKETGTKVILVRCKTSPEDIEGILSAEGVLTSKGGMTSHAAVVARSRGKPCIVGCEQMEIDLEKEEMKIKQESKTIVLKKGTIISINGSTGEVLQVAQDPCGCSQKL
jgi:pyruvate,orthophosphate dikinase